MNGSPTVVTSSPTSASSPTSSTTPTPTPTTSKRPFSPFNSASPINNSLKSSTGEQRFTSLRGVVALMMVFTIFNFAKESSDVMFFQRSMWNLTGSTSTTTAAAAAADEFIGQLEQLSPQKHDEQDATSYNNNHNNLKGAPYLPLPQLVRVNQPLECPDGLTLVPQVSNPDADQSLDRKIPRIVHMTGKSPCLTQAFLEGAQAWQFANHSFYFHHDPAVDYLIYERFWPEFPQLRNSMECLKNAGGAAKADLWRYLVLWEYGGIYTDMDNLPGPYFNATTITPDMDAFFLQEQGGWPSQYFFAISPKHPLMFLAVHDVMNGMHALEDTGKFYVPQVTGPGTIKRAFLQFMGLNSQSPVKDLEYYSKPPKGLYHGKINGNRTVTIEASKKTGNDWVQRSAIRGWDKTDGWAKMNITNYQNLNKKESGLSCVQQLHELYTSTKQQSQEQFVQEVLRHRRW